MSESDVRRAMVVAICHQQNDNPDKVANHVCHCMAPGGIGFGKVSGAVLCRDTYEEIADACLAAINAAGGRIVFGEDRDV